MKKIYAISLVLLAVEIVLAIICGPHSCEWGNTVYFYYGIVALSISFLLPFFHKKWLLSKKVLLSLVFLLAAAATWTACFMLGDFRIICKLF